MKKAIYIVLGCLCVGLGSIGSVLPILPTVPFLLLAAFFFAKSSERLHIWFIHTRLYKDNLESYVRVRGMTKKTKIRIVAVVTIMMGIGFVLMSGVLVGRIVLAIVWVAHLMFFAFGIRTITEEEALAAQQAAEEVATQKEAA